MKTRVFTLILAFLTFLFCVSACTVDSSDPENPTTDLPSQEPTSDLPTSDRPTSDEVPSPSPESELYSEIANGADRLIYGNWYYYLNESTLYMRNLDEPSSPGTPVWQGKGADPLAGKLKALTEFLVDEASTAQNGGVPVLTLRYIENQVSHIVSYNTATYTLTELAATRFDVPQSLYQYEDTIYYSGLNLDAFMGYSFYGVSVSGGNAMLLFEEGGGEETYLVADDDFFYYRASKNLIRCTKRLGKHEIVFEGENNSCMDLFIHDGYLYYAVLQGEITVEGEPLEIHKICRKPMSDLSGDAEEVILEGVYEADYADSKLYYTLAAEQQFMEIQGIDHSFASERNATLHSLDLESRESVVIYDHREDDGGLIGYNRRAMSKDYVVLFANNEQMEEYWELVVSVKTDEESVLS